MLIDFLARQVRPVERHAGVQHRFSERGDLLPSHTAQQDRHQPGRHLIVGKLSFGIAANDELDFFARELVSVTLLADEVDDAHAKRRAASEAPGFCESDKQDYRNGGWLNRVFSTQLNDSELKQFGK